MRRLRWRGHRTGFGAFLVGSGMGLVTNLVTGDPAGWPRALRPVATYAPVIGLGLVAVVGAKALWDTWRLGVRRPVWDGGNPYPGLAAYTQRWAGVYFGRGQEVQDLVIRVHTARTPRGRFVPVVGPSGNGKSSLVLAGLLPALGDAFRVLPPFSPGTNAVGELSAALGRDLSAEAAAAAHAAGTGAPAPHLGDALAALAAARGRSRRLLLVVDQLEEAVVQCVAGDRNAFLALLEAMLVQEARLTVIATVRSDSIGEFQQGLGSDLFRDPLMVNVIGPRELRSVVVEPARLTDTTFQDGLVDEIVRDAGGGDALPLLSYVLSDLYDRAARDHRITWGEYEASGGVSGALTRRAEAAVRDLGPDSLELCLDTLLMFVTLAGSGATRQRVPAAVLEPRELDVVRAFVDARLLTSDRAADGGVVYDIVHEALLRQWQPLADHISRHDERLRRLTELAPLARAWVRSGRERDYLISGARLAEAYSDLRGLSPEVLEFLDACQRSQAGEMERRADLVAREAMSLLGSEPETAVSLAVAAYTELTPTPLVRYALQLCVASGLVQRYPHSGPVNCVAYAPDGRLATATASARDRVQLWDVTGQLVGTVGTEDDVVTACAFGPDGRLAVGYDGAVRVYAPDGTSLHELTAGESVTAVTYAPDRRLAVGGLDGTVRVHGSTGDRVRTLDCASPVFAVAFAADGGLAAGCSNGTVTVWDREYQPRERLDGHHDLVFAIAFGPENRLASGGRYGEVLVRATDAEPDERFGHRGRVNALAYSADGHLASASDDGTVRLWFPDGRLRHVLTEHTDRVRALAWAPDGRLATGSADSTVVVWDPWQRLLETPPRHDSIDKVVFTTNGWMVTVTDGWLKVSTGIPDELGHIFGPGGPIRFLAASPDQRFAACDVNEVHLWDLRRWRVGGSVPDPVVVSTPTSAVAFSPDGTMTTAAPDGMMHTWARDGRCVRTVPGTSRALRMAHLADGTLLAMHADGWLRRWPAEGEGEPRLLGGGPDCAHPIVVGPDGRSVSGTRDGATRVHGPDGRVQYGLPLDASRIAAGAFAPDGRLATGTVDGELLVWDAAGRLLTSAREPGGGAVDVAFAADGRMAASTGGRLRVWPGPVPEETLLDLAHRWPRRELTPTLRERMLLGRGPGSGT